MTFLVSETRDGAPVLGGRRRIVDGLDEAVSAAGEIDGQAYALEPVEEEAPFPPVTVKELRGMGWLGEVH